MTCRESLESNLMLQVCTESSQQPILILSFPVRHFSQWRYVEVEKLAGKWIPRKRRRGSWRMNVVSVEVINGGNNSRIHYRNEFWFIKCMIDDLNTERQWVGGVIILIDGDRVEGAGEQRCWEREREKDKHEHYRSRVSPPPFFLVPLPCVSSLPLSPVQLTQRPHSSLHQL